MSVPLGFLSKSQIFPNLKSLSLILWTFSKYGLFEGFLKMNEWQNFACDKNHFFLSQGLAIC